MSDTILAGDFTVYYESENNQKRIAWTGSATGTRTLNQLYSALQDLFDEPAQMDDLIPMRAVTPDIYQMVNQWFIDDDTVEHLKGGALFTDRWKDSTTEHVLLIGYNPTTEFSVADIGRTIRGGTTLDTGTILDFNTIRDIVTIRPDDPLAGGDEFDSGSEAFTIRNDPFKQVWQVDASVPTFVEETTDANSATDADWQVFPGTEDVGDYVALGFAQRFSKLLFDNGSAGAVQGVGGVVAWEYWDGTAWTALAGVVDGTSGFTAAKSDGQALTFTVPTNWAARSLSGGPVLFYVRARVTTVYSTNPVYDQGFVGGVGAGSFAVHARHGSGSVSGEAAWAGITTIGTIEPNTHIYIFQESLAAAHGSWDERKVIATKGTSDWWGDGQIDILIKTKEAGSIAGRNPADLTRGLATVLARQYSKTYSHFIATALETTGGNTTVPLATADDLNNETGYREFTGSAGVGTFAVGEKITAPGGKASILTAVAGTVAAPVLRYYLIGDPLTDFVNGDAVTGATSGATCTAGTPANIGPSLDTAITVTFGATTEDIKNGNGVRPYSVRINPASLTIERLYERVKYITRRGSVEALQNQDGEEYLGAELQVQYTAQASGNFVQGRRVYDQTNDADGIIIADHDDGTAGDLILKRVRGTFANTNVLSDSPDPSQQFNTPAGNGRCWTFDNSAVTFVNESADADSVTAGDVPLFGDLNDIVYFGVPKSFAKLVIDIGTSGAGGAGTWQYWNGSAWASLEGDASFVDGTNDFKAAAGFQNVTFYPPADWFPTTVNGSPNLYYVRHIVTTAYTTAPVLDQVLVEDNVTATINGAPRTITPTAVSPLGTFAGGTFFGAPGVALTATNLVAGDEQAYQLIDDDGNTQVPPNTVSVTVTNLVSGDSVGMFRRSGANVIKNQFTLAAGNNQGDPDLVVGSTIGADNPTDPNSKVRVVSASGGEHRYRYDSYSGSTFTLSPASTGTSNGGNSSATRLHNTTATFITDEVEVGDYVRNTVEGVFVRVTKVVSQTELDTEAVGNWSGDTYSLNTLVETYASGLNTYVPFIERIADAVSESNKFVQSVNIDVRVVVRKAGVILPFSQDATIVSTGLSIAAIRTSDDIFT